MSSVKRLHQPGDTHHMAQHFGNPQSNIVSAELYITTMPERRLPSGLARRCPEREVLKQVLACGPPQPQGWIIRHICRIIPDMVPPQAQGYSFS